VAPKKTVGDIDVSGKRVLMRVDFNVPLDKKTGNVADDRRIRAAIPTIEYLLNQEATVILVSHLGRPDGQVVEGLRMDKIGVRLNELLAERGVKAEARKLSDCVGDEVEREVKSGEHSLYLLENVRFHAEEEANDPEFARKLAALAEVYVNDAFGTAHRAHASTAGVAAFLPAVAGFLVEKELENLGGLLERPKDGFVVLLGGVKVSDKIGMVMNLLGKAETITIGGAMAYTFLKAQGREVGKSLVEEKQLSSCGDVLQRAKAAGTQIVLPSDVVATDSVKNPSRTLPAVKVEAIPSDLEGADIGPDTIKAFTSLVGQAKTAFWNGPMGAFEFSPDFAKGTTAMAQALAECKGFTVVGGGETAQAVEEAGLEDKIGFISTGGGACLEFLAGLKLPGIEVIQNR
jgi:phosphoglycerate kinase